ncbi:hypothetical protein [Seonamhaeicola sp.]|uniref:hypothetical protein n=1 Tax=Seonamhaeicola sp. TaxID=1912245 RepID=UPI00262E3A5D|nr:hypothetical protein [Seonamhaeicola sp.]
MKYYILLISIVCLLSCGEKKVIELPEISYSDITEIQDVSAAYLFYNEAQPDSVELNRKNLISTTNWLVNVDKRLTLKQVIPHIKFLQEKKANGAHKNEKAKNYFTCHDTGRNNLGFVEFTNIYYEGRRDVEDSINNIFRLLYKKNQLHDSDTIKFNIFLKINEDKLIEFENQKTQISELRKAINSALESRIETKQNFLGDIILYFDKDLTFQDYIFFKSEISNINIPNFKVWNEEFILF